jgi:hypothetical protein
MATILEAQGEGQRLRILALGAGTLDAKSLTVLSLDTLGSVANGQATKIIFPFEISRLMEGASEYLGVARTVPDRGLNSFADLQQQIGLADDILGPIPKQTELLTEIKTIEEEIKADADATTEMVVPGAGKEAASSDPSKAGAVVTAGPRAPIFSTPATPNPTVSTPPIPPGEAADPKRRPPSPPPGT